MKTWGPLQMFFLETWILWVSQSSFMKEFASISSFEKMIVKGVEDHKIHFKYIFVNLKN